MSFALAAYHEPHHHTANVAAPPAAFQGAVRPAERVDHRRNRRMRLAIVIQHALRSKVARHLVPDDLSQILLRDVRPDPKRDREIDQV